MGTTPPSPRAQIFLFYVALLNKQASRYLRLKSERTMLKLYFYVTLFLAGLKTIWNVYTKKATRVSLPGTFLSIFLLLAQFTSAYANACYVRRVELISPLCLYLSRACSTCTTITDKATKKLMAKLRTMKLDSGTKCTVFGRKVRKLFLVDVHKCDFY